MVTVRCRASSALSHAPDRRAQTACGQHDRCRRGTDDSRVSALGDDHRCALLLVIGGNEAISAAVVQTAVSIVGRCRGGTVRMQRIAAGDRPLQVIHTGQLNRRTQGDRRADGDRQRAADAQQPPQRIILPVPFMAGTTNQRGESRPGSARTAAARGGVADTRDPLPRETAGISGTTGVVVLTVFSLEGVIGGGDDLGGGVWVLSGHPRHSGHGVWSQADGAIG